MDLNKHIVKNDDNAPLHSNGYAVVANGNRIGSTSGESFRQRQLVERNRRLVDNYRLSHIGNNRGILRSKQLNAVERGYAGTSHSVGDGRQNFSKPKSFNEPATRTYNPYS
jgi:hypothetical protein